jgi:hypothetical protein
MQNQELVVARPGERGASPREGADALPGGGGGVGFADEGDLGGSPRALEGDGPRLLLLAEDEARGVALDPGGGLQVEASEGLGF